MGLPPTESKMYYGPAHGQSETLNMLHYFPLCPYRAPEFTGSDILRPLAQAL